MFDLIEAERRARIARMVREERSPVLMSRVEKVAVVMILSAFVAGIALIFRGFFS